MAEYNRNRQDAYRQQFDWNEDDRRPQRSYEEEPNYTISENRGYRNSGRYAGMSSGEGGWQSRYERQMNTSREGDYDNQYPSGAHGRHRQGDYGYGSGSSGLTSGYSDFGGDYSQRRNLYDRGYQGMSRRDYENRENRLGGANYDQYGDRGRYSEDEFSGHGGFSSGAHGRQQAPYGRQQSPYGRRYDGGGYEHEDRNYGRGDYRSRDYGRGDSEERSWWDRTSDEVSSWFGDEDAERRRAHDREFRNHRGKGPRNYSRSDDRIREDINDRLSDDPFVDASDIEVNVSNGEVTLTGTVDHRSTKRRAEDLAEAVSGVKNVENRLRVTQYMESQRSGASGMGGASDAASQSSAPIPGSERGRSRETSQTKK